MIKLTPCDIVNDFRENERSTKEYQSVINCLLLHYCKTEEYCNSVPDERNKLHEQCRNLRELLSAIGDLPLGDNTDKCGGVVM